MILLALEALVFEYIFCNTLVFPARDQGSWEWLDVAGMNDG